MVENRKNTNTVKEKLLKLKNNNKNKFTIIIFYAILLTIIAIVVVFKNSYAALREANNIDIKRNPESYWDISNKPVFYGATKITFAKNTIDHFNIKDSRFRIYAKDFEDGDITHLITSTGEVDVTTPGTYTITHTVSDRHNNTTTIQVPVIITDEDGTTNKTMNIERTMYTLPSTWNIQETGVLRCDNGDRQNLGIFVPKDASYKVRFLDDFRENVNQMTYSFVANSSFNDVRAGTIDYTEDWVTLKNAETGGNSVPFMRTIHLQKGNKDVSKTYRIEIEFDDSVKELNYYHYKDDEASFFNKWRESTNEYALVDSEAVQIVVPFRNINYLVNYYSNSFISLDQFLEYYKKAVDAMDKYIGLDLNPEKITDQNVRTKYLIRASVGGPGGAYYGVDHVGITGENASSFFQMNWGGLHELAHGYQGTFGKGQMGLNEVSNNIIGHYIQTDKSIYFHPGNWLGDLAAREESFNASRGSGDVSVKLYSTVNLLSYFEGGITYGKMFSWYRENLIKGTLKNRNDNQNLWTMAIADIYNVDISPYMDAWSYPVSSEVKEDLNSRNIPKLTILKDMVNAESLEKIMSGENTNLKYGPVLTEVYNKYDITGSLNLNIAIDNINLLKDKPALIKDGNKIIKSFKITSSEIRIDDIPVGNYILQMPTLNEYNQSSQSISIIENKSTNCIYTYTSLAMKDDNNYLKMMFRGTYADKYGYYLTFSNNYRSATIEFSGASHYYMRASIKIITPSGEVISEERKGYDAAGNWVDETGGLYFNFGKGSYTVNVEPGYIIEVNTNRPENVYWQSILTKQFIDDYKPIHSEITRYIITETGIKREDMTTEDSEELSYQILKEWAVSQIETYISSVTENELNNRFINIQKKLM